MEERNLSKRIKKEVITNQLLTYDTYKGKTYNSLFRLNKVTLVNLLTTDDYDNFKLSDVSVSKKGSGAKQEHGFVYENLVINQHELTKSIDYIDKWDTIEKNSIKTMKYDSDICLSDFFRQREIDHDYILYIGFWKGLKSNVIEEYKILIKKENWVRYFGNYIDEVSLKKEMDTISNDHKDDAKWKVFVKKYKNLYSYNTSIVKLRFKRDHVNQKRLQCAINFSAFKNLIIRENPVLIHTIH